MRTNFVRSWLFILASDLILLSACSSTAQPLLTVTPIPEKEGPPVFIVEASPTTRSAAEVLTHPSVSPILLEQPFEKAAFQTGPFDFQFYLLQDPGFSQNPSMTWMYSDISGVGTHVSWVYRGPDLETPVVELWGICPEVSSRSTYPGLKGGDLGIREGGILLPENGRPDSKVQFVFKLETSQGTYGGILSFELRQGTQGFEPSKASLYPINQPGQTDGCISELQSSFLPQSSPAPSEKPVITGSSSLPSGLSVEEHLLLDIPQVEPLTFIPVTGSREDILREHQQERGKQFTDNSLVYQGGSAYMAAWKGGQLIARETWDKILNRMRAEVIFDGQTIYLVYLGVSSPIKTLQSLWTYEDHWILETAYVTQQNNPWNGVKSTGNGQVIRDGISLNQALGYEESFGFQLMRGKPFYFFRKEGQIGFSFDGQEVFMGYDQIPHYECCSGSELNPIKAENMVAFFALRDGKWYYVEIGDFE